jgi:hypothetical protein
VPKRASASEYKEGTERPLATSEQIAEGQRKVQLAMATGEAAESESGFTLVVSVYGCTVVGDDIRCSMSFTGSVHRPEAVAVCTGKTQEVVIPAKVQKK